MSADSGARIARFTSSKVIKPYISSNLKVVIDNPVKFLTPGGIAHGYPATLLVDLCNAVLSAREAGILQHQQLHIARQCEVLIRSLASVGIIALVDEATGYQRVREERALATILERWITKEHERWTQTFPYEFYEEIFDSGWQKTRRTTTMSKTLPEQVRDIVREELAPLKQGMAGLKQDVAGLKQDVAGLKQDVRTNRILLRAMARIILPPELMAEVEEEVSQDSPSRPSVRAMSGHD